MGFVPILKASRLVALLIKLGFRIVRQKGSHVRLVHIVDKTRHITVPMHNKDLASPMLLSILKQAKVSIDEFLKILGKK